jgi:hypothetical protein
MCYITYLMPISGLSAIKQNRRFGSIFGSNLQFSLWGAVGRHEARRALGLAAPLRSTGTPERDSRRRLALGPRTSGRRSIGKSACARQHIGLAGHFLVS